MCLANHANDITSNHNYGSNVTPNHAIANCSLTMKEGNAFSVECNNVQLQLTITTRVKKIN